MDASIVKELVGHEHGNNTDRYYYQISIAKMKEELSKFRRPILKTNRKKPAKRLI